MKWPQRNPGFYYGKIDDLFGASARAINLLLSIRERKFTAEENQDEEILGPPQAIVSSGPDDRLEAKDNSPPLREGYLGLQYDDSRFIVKRKGYEVTVDLAGSRVSWGILQALDRAKDIPLPDGKLRDVWLAIGRADNPEKSTIVDAVSDLRRKLRTLEITINSIREIGRQLVPFQGAPPPKRRSQQKKRQKKRSRNNRR